jgi:dUTPase
MNEKCFGNLPFYDSINLSSSDCFLPNPEIAINEHIGTLIPYLTNEAVLKLPEYKFNLVNDLSDNFLPTRSDPDATGWDVRSRIDIAINPFEYFKIPLGFRAFPPKGWWFSLHPRSSTVAKKHCHVLIGTIDETYPEELIFAGQYIPSEDRQCAKYLKIEAGERIAQIIPIRREEMLVKKISNDEFDLLCKNRAAERTSGFGSSGK